MLVEAPAKLPAKRWATIAPNYEYGQSAAGVQKTDVGKAARHPVGRRAVAAAGQDRRRSGGAGGSAANPEAILNVTFGADLVKLCARQYPRPVQGSPGGVFLTGEPEYLDPLKEETPEGWIVTGYPWYESRRHHDTFLNALSGQ